MTVQAPRTAAVLALLADTTRRHTGPGPVVLGIDGRSGSGKSALARSVVSALGDDDGVTLLALEDAYRGWHGLAEGVRAVADGVLAPLAEGRPGSMTRYDWEAGELDGPLHVPEPGAPLPRILVMEGCGAGAAACAPFVDALVWLDAPAAVRRRRALTRDTGTWAHLWDAWAAQEDALLAERDARAAADLVLSTDRPPG